MTFQDPCGKTQSLFKAAAWDEATETGQGMGMLQKEGWCSGGLSALWLDKAGLKEL